jgi:surface antigen
LEKKMTLHRLLVCIAIVLIAGNVNAECNQEGTGGGEVVGTLLGAALGGFLGAQIGDGTGNKVAIGAGVLAGGLLGNKLGASMDCQDQQYHVDTTQNALETQPVGQSSTWVNPDTGHSGTVTPVKTFQTADGTHCREFNQLLSVDGQTEEVTGTACRQADGTWKIDNG